LARIVGLSDEEFLRMTEETPYERDRCPTCFGEGSYRLDGEDRECDCREQKGLHLLYNAARLPSLYQSIGPKDIWDHLRPYMPELEDYMAGLPLARRYGKGLLLHGTQGTGKTYLLSLVLKRAAKAGYDTRFARFPDLWMDWAESWKDAVAQKRFTEMKQAHFLLLDDVLSDGRNRSGYLESGLEAVVRHRHDWQLPTLVTTNMSPGQLADEFPRVWSILGGTVQVIRVEGPDQRPNRLRQMDELIRDGETLPIV
jgi:DNA replication protein DnaC